MKNLLLIAFLAFSLISFSQETIKKTQKKQQVSEYSHSGLSEYQQPYIIKDKLLASYFKSGKIDKDFPKYNYGTTKKDNLLSIRNWIETPGKKDLLNSEGVKRYTEELTKYSDKQIK